jgi:hypothetical protein
MEKIDLVNHYNELKNKLGHQPSSTEFYKETGISQNKLEYIFGSSAYKKLVNECGDTPKAFGKEKSDFEEILIKYGFFFREIGKHPVEADWKQQKYTPSVSGITQSFKIGWTEMPKKFLEFAYNKPEWQDVVELIPNKNLTITPEPSIRIEQLSDQIKNYIPPIIQDLIDISFDDSKSLEFERKVNIAFEMLGFDVKQFGQGTGRKPDGIALHKPNTRFAILIDSKSRSDGYKFGTDDRTFVEYIKTYTDRLKNDGFDKLFFLVVSSKFTSIPDDSIKRLALETHVPITFLASKLLLNILANKIEKPRIFNLDKFRELLIDSGEITQVKIDTFLRNSAKSQSV